VSQIDWARGVNPDDERPLEGFASIITVRGATRDVVVIGERLHNTERQSNKRRAS
jgi:hypothetical protein